MKLHYSKHSCFFAAIVACGLAFFVYAALRDDWGHRKTTRESDLAEIWLTQLTDPNQSMNARRRLRTAGTNVLPTLLRMLAAQDSTLVKGVNYIDNEVTGGSLIPEKSISKNEKALAGFAVLGRIARTAIPELTNMIARNESSVLAVSALREIGIDAAPALRFAFRTRDPNVRVRALGAIIEACPQDKGFIEESLAYALSDPDPFVRSAALTLIPMYTSLIRVSRQSIGTNVFIHISRNLSNSEASIRELATQVVSRITAFQQVPKYRE